MLSGTLGAGKTRLAEEVADLLRERGLRHAVLDLDALCQAWPPPDDDPWHDRLALANLAAVWPGYAAAGVGHLVLARVVADPADRQRYERALAPDVDLTVVLVQAGAATRRARLTAREPDGYWRSGHLARSDGLARQLADLSLEDVRVDNDGRPARAVAEEVLLRLGW